MELSLNKIFGRTPNAGEEVSTLTTSASLEDGTNALRQGETYVSYGKRLCGIPNGNVDHLPIYFQRVIQSEKNRYTSNANLQNASRQRTKEQIISKQTSLETEKNNLAEVESRINAITDSIQDKQGEIAILKTGEGETNKEAKVKFYFGAIIIALLTVYLFVFYSSTFYSAFFGSDTVENLSDAMFNTQAISKAWNLGFGPLVFVCTAPVIFMALGYALHYFSLASGVSKYFKVAGCIVITFIFDCLLAYSIAAKCYEYEAMNSLEELPPYSMSLAMNDVNVWIVIFCGFITYMIWGIVLDMVITAYGEFRSNATTIEKIRNDINQLENKRNTLDSKLNTIKNAISKIEGEIRALENSLDNVTIPLSVIRQAVADFFTGWTAVVGVLTPKGYDTSIAKSHYDACINSLV